MVESPRLRALTIAALLVLGCLLVLPSTAMAADFEAGETRIVSADETIDGSFYYAGQRLVVEGVIEGDLIAATQEVTISGRVDGSLIAAASMVSISGEVGGGARVAAETVSVAGSIGEELVALGGTVLVSESGTVGDAITGAMGELSIRGSVGDGVTGAIGALDVAGSIGGSVDVEAESVTLARTARIEGDLRHRSAQEAEIAPGAEIGGTVERLEPTTQQTEPLADNPFLGLLGLWLGLLVLGWLLLWLRPAHLLGVAVQIRLRALASLGIGVLVWLGQIVALVSLFLLAVVFGALAPQLGGAFVAPILVLVFVAVVVALVAQVYVAAAIGQLIGVRGSLSPWLAYAAGALIWALVFGLLSWLHGALGALLFFGAWFLALGALALHIAERRRAEAAAPPPPPVAAEPAPPPIV